MKCSKHPTYKVMRKPTADCNECKMLWEIKQMTPEQIEAGRQRLESRRVMTSTNVGDILEGLLDIVDIFD